MFNLQKITDKIAAGKVPVGSHVGFDSPFLTEALAGCGFDFIWIDAEHSAIDKKDIQNHLLACRAAGVAGIVRVPWNDHVSVSYTHLDVYKRQEHPFRKGDQQARCRAGQN